MNKIMPSQKRRAFWLKHLHQWHWISSALCLIGMLLFSATGITLNHASDIEARPQVTTLTRELPADLLEILAEAADETGEAEAPLPPVLRDWLRQEMDLRVGSRPGEWSEGEIYVSLPRPGGDAWLSLDLESGEVFYERTDRGWISYFNDLHKGRNTGTAWAWFIDIFAVACLVFCLTGLFLLQLHGGSRAATWPTVGFGLVAPLLLVLLFIH
ncbi:PepSY-associated TM helix domain-containing protein [Telmatospirillum sp. J64-1]|uniref:PepSY-associated TM helix domain-containing protein n=1 Tax=Telmatospirillum sp. J64-1 TaxID=2502183 RepID=UPI001C8F3F2D|nr:PepSY-associated TM helix domain-containing protein [Telmatospirillum sp. J64-1]